MGRSILVPNVLMRRHAVSALAFGALGVACGSARAFSSEYAANQALTRVTVPTIGGQGWAARVAGTAIEAARVSSAIAAPGGGVVSAEVSAVLSRRAIAGIAARALPILGPLGTAAAAVAVIADLYESGRIRIDPAGSGEGWQDPGQAASEVPAYEVTYGGNNEFKASGETQEAVCQAWAQAVRGMMEANQGYVVTIRAAGYSVGTGNCWYDILVKQGESTLVEGYSAGPTPVSSLKRVCPPGASGPVTLGYDGKCPTGSYTTPLTAKEAADIAATASAARTNAQMAEVLAAGLKAVTPMPLPTTNDVAYNVRAFSPATVQGPTTQTETATAVQTVATNFSPSYVPGQGNFHVAWTTRTQTTTQPMVGGVATGAPTVSTVVTTPAQVTTQVDGAGAAPTGTVTTEGGDPCAADPGRLGCIGLGEPPQVETPKRTVALAWSLPDLGLPTGSCPPPYAIGRGYVVDFYSTCSGLELARPVFISMAYLTALGIVVAALRR